MKLRNRAACATAMVPVIILACFVLSACATFEQNVALGTVGATVLGAQSPSSEVEQIYYLGVFDPQEQIPPTVYRVRVRGQASFISFTRFASGWVRADLLDSLGTGIEFDKASGGIKFTQTGDPSLDALSPGRRLVLFGPEGFREAPKNHRLVVVMGSSPEKFFQAVDESLGEIAQARTELRGAALDRAIFEALAQVRSERERLDDLARVVEDIGMQATEPTGGAR